MTNRWRSLWSDSERHLQIAARVGKVGFEPERLLEMPDGLVQLAGRRQRDSQIVVRLS